MNILHTVESYNPSVGGAQEVVRQISEGLVQRGHTVTVATSCHPDRHIKDINGVHIEEFDIHGNNVQGIYGESERYKRFLRQGNFDLMMNYAAQQWATDLVFPLLDELSCKKVLIPCGFSGLYLPEFANYFNEMMEVLRHYDHLVFHADDYRDTNFARKYGLTRWSIIPNGASLIEFESSDTSFRQRYKIQPDDFLLITVGSHTGVKGHELVLKAFHHLKTEHATLIIIGNTFGQAHWWTNFIRPILSFIKRGDLSHMTEMILNTILGGIGPTGCLTSCRAKSRWMNLLDGKKKKVLLLNLPRAEVVAAYNAADLFLFGSNIEYSPIVLYEAMASHTPFVSLACGNAAEIADWSGGGIIAPTIQKDRGFVDGDPSEFANLVDNLLVNAPRHKALAEAGYQSWLKCFTWEKIITDYEALYSSLLIS